MSSRTLPVFVLAAVGCLTPCAKSHAASYTTSGGFFVSDFLPINDPPSSSAEHQQGFVERSGSTSETEDAYVSKFPSAAGTLTGVTIELDADISWNTQASGGGAFSVVNFTVDPGLSGPNFVMDIDAFSMLNAGEDVSFSMDGFTPTEYLTGADVAPYVGGGAVTFEASLALFYYAFRLADEFPISGDVYATFSGNINVTYTYTPSGGLLPEPSAIPLLGCAGLTLLRRRSRRTA